MTHMLDCRYPEDPLKEGKGTFYAREITLTYSGYLTAGNYFFAVADDPCSEGISTTGKCKDYFSGRSRSAVAIPEPHLLALLGAGLLALAIVRRRALFRQN